MDRDDGSYVTQHGFDLRCEWGEMGVRTLAPLVDAIVIVDVLSVSTAVDVATSRGASVHPCRWKDGRARERAEALGAVLAGPRGSDGPSLSPVSLRTLGPGASIVLPSPNGSTLSLASGATPTFAGCLRNASAVAAAAARVGGTVGVIAAGERWPGQATLRPSFEDWIGAGAILVELARLAELGRLPGTPSPQARAAIAAWRDAQPDLAHLMRTCASGRELIDRGFGEDVELAADHDTSSAVPRLIGARPRYEDVSERSQPLRRATPA